MHDCVDPLRATRGPPPKRIHKASEVMRFAFERCPSGLGPEPSDSARRPAGGMEANRVRSETIPMPGDTVRTPGDPLHGRADSPSIPDGGDSDPPGRQEASEGPFESGWT